MVNTFSRLFLKSSPETELNREETLTLFSYVVRFTRATPGISLINDPTVTITKLLEKTTQLVTHGDLSELGQVGELGTAPGSSLQIAYPLSIKAYEAVLSIENALLGLIKKEQVEDTSLHEDLIKLLVYSTECTLRSFSAKGFVHQSVLDHVVVVVREYKTTANLTIPIP